jgi:uncharacterized linocin/CFP29 family protein
MSHLLRELAPLGDDAWSAVDDEARERLTPRLAARRLVDFSGPHGWQHSATNLGRKRRLPGLVRDGVWAAQRQVLPLVELHAPFTVAREELQDIERGARDPDLSALDEAAERLALAENGAVFHGWEDAGIVGIGQGAKHDPIVLGEHCDRYPRHVAMAVERLLASGIAGPYGLALGPDAYTRVLETTEHGGYPLLDHLRKILLGGPLVRAPGVDGGAVVSMRGGDFVFESGEDIAVGYDRHDADTVHLYLVESFSFRVLTPEAAVVLTP